MLDLLFGRWMTEPVHDARSGMWIAAEVARAALRGWNDAEVRRVSSYLRRITSISQSYDGAIRLAKRMEGGQRTQAFLTKLSTFELHAILTLRAVAHADLERAQQYSARLNEIQRVNALLPDARVGVQHTLQVEAWKRTGDVARRVKLGQKRGQWERLATTIWDCNQRLSNVRVAERVAEMLGTPKEARTIRAWLASAKKLGRFGPSRPTVSRQ